jgi:hypothetical protein
MTVLHILYLSDFRYYNRRSSYNVGEKVVLE